MDKKSPNSPKTADFILKLFIKEDPFAERTGDLQEIFPSQVRERGLTRARLWYTFHQNDDTIYRVADENYSTTAANLGQALKQEFPEVKHVARVVKLGGFLKNEKGFFNATDIQCVDSEFFNMFSYPLVTGNLPSPLEQPFQVLITQELATRLFGNNDPVGQTINYNNRFDFVVNGILQNIPENTHMKFDMLASMMKSSPWPFHSCRNPDILEV